MPVSIIYIIQVWYAVLVLKITSFVDELSYQSGCRKYSSIGVTSGNVGSGVAERDPQNITDTIINIVQGRVKLLSAAGSAAVLFNGIKES